MGVHRAGKLVSQVKLSKESTWETVHVSPSRTDRDTHDQTAPQVVSRKLFVGSLIGSLGFAAHGVSSQGMGSPIRAASRSCGGICCKASAAVMPLPPNFPPNHYPNTHEIAEEENTLKYTVSGHYEYIYIYICIPPHFPRTASVWGVTILEGSVIVH